MSKIGDWIEKNLDNSEWYQSSLAREIGVTPASVSNWVSGHTIPSPQHMDKLIEIFGPYEEADIRNDGEIEVKIEAEDNDADDMSLVDEIGGEITRIGTFNPKIRENFPDCAGIYILYTGKNNQLKPKNKRNNVKFTGNPTYIGEGLNIRKRLQNHREKWWFQGVDIGVYIEIDGRKNNLRKGMEKILIKLLSPEHNGSSN